MERFYKIALIVAILFLIVCLIGIGILMQYQNAGMKFPIHPNACPDFWNSTDGTTCTPDSKGTNKGTFTNPSISLTSYSTICDKYKWAKQYKVNWDGVSNYNGC